MVMGIEITRRETIREIAQDNQIPGGPRIGRKIVRRDQRDELFDRPGNLVLDVASQITASLGARHNKQGSLGS